MKMYFLALILDLDEPRLISPNLCCDSAEVCLSKIKLAGMLWSKFSL